MTDPTDPTDPPSESLVRKADFAQLLLRIAHWLDGLDEMGVTIIVHKPDLAIGGEMETAVMTTLPSRAQQRVALLEALFQCGLADGAVDPGELALRDYAEINGIDGSGKQSTPP